MSKMVVQHREAKGLCARRADLQRQFAYSSRVSQTLRCQAQQCSTQLVEIDQRTGDIHSLGVLGDAAVAHLGKAEDAFADEKGCSPLARTRDWLRSCAAERHRSCRGNDNAAASCHALAARVLV